ncbi:MAG TPA: hydantoinase B/oxoprolinase family protein, partial [Solirubrobacteraceae bacterium]
MQAITREMATVLMRTSRSPIFNEIGDLLTVIFDRRGRTLAQTEYASIIGNGAHPPLQQIIAYFGDDLHDGDVILHNDVYSGGNQNADVGVFLPIFFEGELVAWSASKGHVADIGGMTAGGYDPRAREVWQEAFRIPPVKIMEGGELRRDVWDLVRANIRLEIVAEDIKAMIGACTIGRRRLDEVLGRYG